MTLTSQVVDQIYESLSGAGDLASLFSEDVTFHVVRSTPESVLEGKQALFDYFKRVAKVAPLDGDIKLEQAASNEEFGFSLHVEAEGTPREHRHLMVWRIAEGEIKEAWELPFGGPPSLQGVNIAEMERLGYQTVVLEPGEAS